jgi:hypothetical protein
MALSRSWIKRLENEASSNLAWFRLHDGTRFFYDRDEVGQQLFLHGCASIRDRYTAGEDHELPEILRMIVDEAANPREVLERFRSGNPEGMFFDPMDLLDADQNPA